MNEFETKVIEGLAKIILLLENKSPQPTKKTSGSKKKYSIANKPCNKCNGLISWDEYSKENPTLPIHVDENGLIIEDGTCPEYVPEY